MNNSIGYDKVKLIHEIKDMCFFPTTEEKKKFLSQVAGSVGCSRIEDIQEPDYGTAYLTAKAILHKIGEDIFKPKNMQKFIKNAYEQRELFRNQ